jgi:hypothetical protein
MTKYSSSLSNKSKSRPRKKHQRYNSRGAKVANKKATNTKAIHLDAEKGHTEWKKKRNITNPDGTKRDTKAWWRSLTAEQQADYVYSLMLKKHGKADWQKEYARVIKQGLYLK